MFITLEGPEGSGKTSQVPLLADYLRQQGHTVLTTREPGGTEIGNKIRSIIMDMGNKNMCSRTEMLLFCSARAQLVDEVIRPNLAQGVIVLCDRYADSTLAYQGYGHGFDIDFLKRLLAFVTGDLWPDLTLLLDIDSEAGLNRRRQGGGEWNRMDDYTLQFHRRVRQGYLQMAAQEPQRWRTVSSDRPIQDVQTEIRKVVMEKIG